MPLVGRLYAAHVTAAEAHDAEDWTAVAQAISARLADARMTQMDVASQAQVSLTTLRELQHNLNSRRRRPQTLTAISEALGWPPNYLAEVLAGRTPRPHESEANDPVLSTLDTLHAELRSLRSRVETIEQRLADGDGSSEAR